MSPVAVTGRRGPFGPRWSRRRGCPSRGLAQRRTPLLPTTPPWCGARTRRTRRGPIQELVTRLDVDSARDRGSPGAFSGFEPAVCAEDAIGAFGEFEGWFSGLICPGVDGSDEGGGFVFSSLFDGDVGEVEGWGGFVGGDEEGEFGGGAGLVEVAGFDGDAGDEVGDVDDGGLEVVVGSFVGDPGSGVLAAVGVGGSADEAECGEEVG